MAMVVGGEEDRAVNGNFTVPREVTRAFSLQKAPSFHQIGTLVREDQTALRIFVAEQMGSYYLCGQASHFHICLMCLNACFSMCLNRILILGTVKFCEVPLTALEEENH